MFDVSITDQGLWWMRDWNIETIFCKVQDWSDVNEGQYWVYAIGNDGCGARMALGHHWGTFALTAEPPLEPVHALAQALLEQDIPGARFAAMRPGQVHTLTA